MVDRRRTTQCHIEMEHASTKYDSNKLIRKELGAGVPFGDSAPERATRSLWALGEQHRTHSTAEGVPMLQGGARRPGQSTLWPADARSRTALLAAGVAIAMGGAALVRGRGDGASAAGITEWASNDRTGSPS
jgi:hypothetical protein